MPTASAVRVVALLSMVGIASLNSASGTQPLGRGVSSKIIGTNSRYDTEVYIPVHMLHENEGRLVTELIALWRASAIAIYLDGEAITAAAQLTNYSEPDGLERKGEVFIEAHTLWQGLSGTYTEYFDDTNNRWRVERTANAADEVMAVVIPANYFRGTNIKPRGIRLYYSVNTADMDDLTLEVYTSTPPADGAIKAAGSAIHTNGTYDSDHDSAVKRGDDTGAPEYHTLEFTFASTDVAYLDQESITVLINIDCAGAAGAVFTYWGLSFLFYERPGPRSLGTS